MGVVSSKLRNSAKGQPCFFSIPHICKGGTETTVLAHIRDANHGMATKADDWSAGFACVGCHEAIDQHRLSREDELFFSMRAMQRTQAHWIAAGLIVVPQDTHRAKPSGKIMQRRHIATGEPIR